MAIGWCLLNSKIKDAEPEMFIGGLVIITIIKVVSNSGNINTN